MPVLKNNKSLSSKKIIKPVILSEAKDPTSACSFDVPSRYSHDTPRATVRVPRIFFGSSGSAGSFAPHRMTEM
jgi:hypothetical protein